MLAIAAGVLVVILGVGGGLFYMVHSGRLASRGGVVKPQVAVPIATHVILLEPMVVNLADQGGESYLRIAIALRVYDSPLTHSATPKAPRDKEDKGASETAPIKDTLLMVLGRQTADDLLAAKGSERLKTAIKAAFAEHNSDMNVQDVFFTEFLVQR